MSHALSKQKTSAEIRTVAFTDHNAVVLKIKYEAPTTQWGCGYRKLNSTLLEGVDTRQAFKDKWQHWLTKRHKYSDTTRWWTCYVKGEKMVFQTGGTTTRTRI
jgi:hypothetical protein